MTNVIKVYSALKKLLKCSTVEVVTLSSRQCTCIKRIGPYTDYISRSFSTQVPALDQCGRKMKYKNLNRSIDAGNKHLTVNHESKTTSDSYSLQYKVKGENDPNTFGNIGNKTSFEDHEGDEGDKREETYLENAPPAQSKLRTKQYADMIKTCIREKRFGDAIDVLETRMLKQDRVKPETYIYSLLISACGRWGYTKKAFQLYNQMKKRGLKVNGATYTGLFNACSNSPWPEDGLKRATHLRELMIEKGIECNTTHYHAMIKAFGHCGGLTIAFMLVDEMVEHQLQLRAETFNFLLHACISDKEAGFRHAILVWHKMLQKKVKPNVYTYNLILRCVRDCSIGESDIAQNVLEQVSESGGSLILPLDESKLMLDSGGQKPNKLPEVGTNSVHDEDTQLVTINQNLPTNRENRPNLLAAQPHLGNIICLAEVTKPQDRLVLIGGCSGVLQQMESGGVTPDIKTFTLLLDSIPSTISAENALLSAVKKNGLRLDVDFFNMLIKKRSMRFDYGNAREVLRQIQLARLHPDIVTFGVLALGCQTEDEAKQLLMDMKSAGYRINAEILGAMLHQACVRHNFHYIMKILYIAKEEEVQPNAEFLKHLENLNTSCWAILKNKNTDPDVPEYVRSEAFSKQFRSFSYRYKGWLREVKPEEEAHPWDQFRKQKPQERETQAAEGRKYRSSS